MSLRRRVRFLPSIILVGPPSVLLTPALHTAIEVSPGFRRLFRKVAPSVVLILTLDNKFASGFLLQDNVVFKDTVILTNFHVVDHSRVATVVFKPAASTGIPSADEVVKADVVKIDSQRDLAFIQPRSCAVFWMCAWGARSGRCVSGWRLAARVAAQSSDGIEQLQPMPDCRDAKLLKGLVR